VDLISRNAERRAGGRTDLGGIIGEGRKVVARKRRRGDELRTHQLHAVAGVAGEPNNY
jgi:hypothetical protein